MVRFAAVAGTATAVTTSTTEASIASSLGTDAGNVDPDAAAAAAASAVATAVDAEMGIGAAEAFFLPFEVAKKAESMRRSMARFSCFSCSFFDNCQPSPTRAKKELTSELRRRSAR